MAYHYQILTNNASWLVPLRTASKSVTKAITGIPHTEWPEHWHGKNSLQIAAPYFLRKQHWKNFTRFSDGPRIIFLRNPLERFISMTKMWARNNRPGRKDNFHITAEEFYTRLSEHTHTEHFDFHAGAFMKPYADNIKFDYIVRFENLHQYRDIGHEHEVSKEKEDHKDGVPMEYYEYFKADWYTKLPKYGGKIDFTYDFEPYSFLINSYPELPVQIFTQLIDGTNRQEQLNTYTLEGLFK